MLQQGNLNHGTPQYLSTFHPLISLFLRFYLCPDFTFVHVPWTIGCHCIKSPMAAGPTKHPYPPSTFFHLWAQAPAWNSREADWETVPPENSFPAHQFPHPSMQLKAHKHWGVAESIEMLWPPRRGSPGPSCHQPYPHRLPLCPVPALELLKALTTTEVESYSYSSYSKWKAIQVLYGGVPYKNPFCWDVTQAWEELSPPSFSEEWDWLKPKVRLIPCPSTAQWQGRAGR